MKKKKVQSRQERRRTRREAERDKGRQIERAREEEFFDIMPGSDGRREILGSALDSRAVQISMILIMTMTIIIIKIIIIAIRNNNNNK